MNAVKQTLLSKKVLVIALAVALSAVIFFAAIKPAIAVNLAELQEEIARLEGRIGNNKETLTEIRSQKDTLENRIASLNSEIAEIDDRIRLTELKIKELEIQIDAKTKELDEQKELLGENLKQLYKTGDLSTLELLASSDSYTDFINDQEYLERIKAGIQESADKVEALKNQLEKQRDTQELLRIEQRNQREAVAGKKAEQNELLAETEGQESRYQTIVSRDNRALEEAYSALNAELARRAVNNTGQTYFGTGSYPFATACTNPYPAPWGESNCWYHPYVDAGGYPYRQCTSYVFWRRGNIGRPVPGYMGNAAQWPGSASAAGYKVNYTPKKGAIGVIPGGFGHVFVVEEVLGNNQVRASQYNDPGQNGGQWGMYSEVIYNTSGLVFIH